LYLSLLTKTFILSLYSIHNKNFIHRDIHSGNILCSSTISLIGDLGLSQPANYTSSNNEIYGVIPYIAPEIFKGVGFSKESDIYSFGMIMWELTTGCKPFANVEHDVNLIYEILDGKRPEITSDTPEYYANLMKKCWDSNPSKRPTIDEIFEEPWIYTNKIKQAEKKRLELIRLKKIGPEFSEKSHPKAIYTSRALSSIISKSINLSSMVLSNMEQGMLYHKI
jgi:serine/threonine protein kinase